MFDFRHFSPESLAANESFRRWVLFDTPSDRIFWKSWIDSNPDKQGLVEQAVRLLELSERTFNRVTDEEVTRELDRLSTAIENLEESRSIRPVVSAAKWYFVAASCLVILVGGWLFNRERSGDSPYVGRSDLSEGISDGLKSETNTDGTVLPIYLSDGSTVLLQPGSRLRYPVNFEGSIREVFLTGEAFFEVSKNPGKPFIVYAGDLVTKVLGTSFKISAFEKEKNVTVVVKTGRVSVFPMPRRGANGVVPDAGPKEGMILTPNQQIVYTAGESRLTRSLVDMPEVIEVPVQGQSFTFRAAPVGEVLEALARAYGVEIIFDRDSVKNCLLTATLEDEPLFEKIELICKTIGADFEQMDGTLIVSSQGCD